MWRSPQRTGSVAESGRALTGLMARSVDPAGRGVVVELGPGPGALTHALLDRGVAPERLLLIEANPRFVALLRSRFPTVRVIEGDAWDVRNLLRIHGGETSCAAVLSGLPLLNFPAARRRELIETVMGLLAPTAGRFVQFSYGFKAPVAAPPGTSVERSGWIIRNMPPARVWIYRNVPGATPAGLAGDRGDAGALVESGRTV